MTPNQIKRYLNGQCSPEEAADVKQWLAVPENEAIARTVLGDVWANSEPVLTTEKPDFDRLLQRVRFRINGDETPFRPKPANWLLTWITRAAAILLVPVLVYTAYLYTQTSEPTGMLSDNAVREIYTKPGTRIHLTLSDGTKVWLNDGTTLRYPEQFEGKHREVFVDGEAYFEVHSDKQHPFVVDNPLMKTVVTGTRFNLHAYSADRFFEATLLEGKIILERESQKAEMAPGEQAFFDPNTSQLEMKAVRAQNAVGWINGKLIIQNEKLDQAVKKISRWYNVDIQLRTPELKDYELTCTLSGEKLEQCMGLISNALQVNYQIKKLNEQQIVILTKR